MESYLYLFLCLSVWYLILVYVFKVTFVNLWLKPRRIEKHFAKQGIRGPKYNFFTGNIKEIMSLAMGVSSQPMTLSHDILPRVLSFYHHWKKIYGSSFLVWFGPTPRIIIVEPALIKDIFNCKSELFEKNDSPPLVRKLEGDGLLSLHGAKWAHHRKIMAPLFYMENIKLMIPFVEKSIMDMLEKWSIDIIKSNNTGKVEIEVSKSFGRLTEDVITQTVFGSSYEDGKFIFDLQARQMVYAIQTYNNVFIPGFRFLPTKRNRDSWKLDREMKNSLVKLINVREKTMRDGGRGVSKECPNKDLLEVMIKASNNKSCVLKQTNNQKGCCASSPFPTKITIHDIVEECKTIFFAGKHTTSNLLTWTTVLLAMHPQWQEMAREEVLRVCGAHDPPTRHHIDNLKTLDLITKETLRLYPPVVAIIRRAKVDACLGEIRIPSGTELLIPILALHHDTSSWGQDANEFNPARFSKGVAHATKHPWAFMSFGLGDRRCIGQNLAILQAKLTIAMILQRFSFHLSPNYKHAPTVLMLLYPQYGAPIIFQKL